MRRGRGRGGRRTSFRVRVLDWERKRISGGWNRDLAEALRMEEVPLLDFVEAGEEGDRDEDDNCFLAVADFELWVEERFR